MIKIIFGNLGNLLIPNMNIVIKLFLKYCRFYYFYLGKRVWLILYDIFLHYLNINYLKHCFINYTTFLITLNIYN